MESTVLKNDLDLLGLVQAMDEVDEAEFRALHVQAMGRTNVPEEALSLLVAMSERVTDKLHAIYSKAYQTSLNNVQALETFATLMRVRPFLFRYSSLEEYLQKAEHAAAQRVLASLSVDELEDFSEEELYRLVRLPFPSPLHFTLLAAYVSRLSDQEKVLGALEAFHTDFSRGERKMPRYLTERTLVLEQDFFVFFLMQLIAKLEVTKVPVSKVVSFFSFIESIPCLRQYPVWTEMLDYLLGYMDSLDSFIKLRRYFTWDLVSTGRASELLPTLVRSMRDQTQGNKISWDPYVVSLKATPFHDRLIEVIASEEDVEGCFQLWAIASAGSLARTVIRNTLPDTPSLHYALFANLGWQGGDE